MAQPAEMPAAINDMHHLTSFRGLIRVCTGLLLLGLAATAAADFRGDAAAVAHKARMLAMQPLRLLYGPSQPELPDYLDLDGMDPAEVDLRLCGDLYQRRQVLLRQTLDYVPAYLDDPRNATAMVVTTMGTTPIYFYYLGFTALQDYQRAQRNVAIEAELDALRRAAAALDCFVTAH
ncbi:MAG: hypothetical protein H6978_05580 [Gammaproteobacteria bacterium]|nr:hypothetical protein [Gammaproteobacteria bacterium]